MRSSTVAEIINTEFQKAYTAKRKSGPNTLFSQCGYYEGAVLIDETMTVCLPCDLPKHHAGEHNFEKMFFHARP